MQTNATFNITPDEMIAEFDQKMTEYSLYYVYIGAAVFVSSFFQVNMSQSMTKPTKRYVGPAKTQISLGIPQADHSLRCPHEQTLGPQLPTERTAKTLIRLGGCPG